MKNDKNNYITGYFPNLRVVRKVHTVGKKQTPEDDVRTRLRAHILAGGSPKEFAIGEGRHSTMANKMLPGMGLKKVFITEEEHELLIKLRKESAA
jgi:hypothetical protein